MNIVILILAIWVADGSRLAAGHAVDSVDECTAQGESLATDYERDHPGSTVSFACITAVRSGVSASTGGSNG